MAFKFNPTHVLRLLQALFAIIAMATYASVAAYFNSLPAPVNTTPSQLAFPIFASVLTLLITLPFLVLTPQFFPTLAHRYAIFSIEAITCILWFAAWIASASYIGSLSVCRGGICTTAIVGTIVATFEWLIFVVTAYFAGGYCFSPTSGQAAHENGSSKGRRFGRSVNLKGLNISRPMPMSASNEGVKIHDSWLSAGNSTRGVNVV